MSDRRIEQLIAAVIVPALLERFLRQNQPMDAQRPPLEQPRVEWRPTR